MKSQFAWLLAAALLMAGCTSQQVPAQPKLEQNKSEIFTSSFSYFNCTTKNLSVANGWTYLNVAEITSKGDLQVQYVGNAYPRDRPFEAKLNLSSKGENIDAISVASETQTKIALPNRKSYLISVCGIGAGGVGINSQWVEIKVEELGGNPTND